MFNGIKENIVSVIDNLLHQKYKGSISIRLWPNKRVMWPIERGTTH